MTAVSEPPENPAADAIRQISVEVDGVEGQLRVRIAERAGEMRAWVMGQTSETVERVQAGLSDLTRALTSAGFDSEVWAPHVISGVASASDVQTSTEQNDRNVFDESGSGGRGEEHNDSRNNRRSRNEDEDENNFRSHMRIS
jgi:hypothetical protein